MVVEETETSDVLETEDLLEEATIAEGITEDTTITEEMTGDTSRSLLSKFNKIKREIHFRKGGEDVTYYICTPLQMWTQWLQAPNSVDLTL